MVASSMAFSIATNCKGIFYSRQEKEENAARNDEHPIERHLLLSLGSYVDVEGEIVTDLNVSRHRFGDCNPSFLNTFIREKEPLPLVVFMDSDAANRKREAISRKLFDRVSNCAEIPEVKCLQVEIVYRVCEKRKVNDDDVVLREMRMSLMEKNVDCSSAGEECCAVCLEEMGGGGKGVVRTPCGHMFHARCVGRWFEKSEVCPVCRFKVGP